jgi:hypothetical protein
MGGLFLKLEYIVYYVDKKKVIKYTISIIVKMAKKTEHCSIIKKINR